jgi:hypothetical protein
MRKFIVLSVLAGRPGRRARFVPDARDADAAGSRQGRL